MELHVTLTSRDIINKRCPFLVSAPSASRAHACVGCQVYNDRKLLVREATAAHRAEVGEEWHAVLVCGVGGMHRELGIDGEGLVVYVD